MVSENDADLRIEYSEDSWPPTNWTRLEHNAKNFTTNSGAFKIAFAEIVLKNKDGYYTSGTKIQTNKYIRIRTDVRGTWDTIFWGKTGRRRGKHSGTELPFLTLPCYGLGRKLLDDTITYDYYEKYLDGVDYTIKTVIEDFLASPDSGFNTNITLETDSGLITTTPPAQNFRKTTLFDAIKQFGDSINYSGYVYVDGSNNIKLNFKANGSILADPAISLDEPYIVIEPDFNPEDVGNHVFPWGDIDSGWPPTNDAITEDPLEINNWDSPSGAIISQHLKTVDATYVKVGDFSVKSWAIFGATKPDAEYTFPVSTFPTGFDLTSGRYENLIIFLKLRWTSHTISATEPFPPKTPDIFLTDIYGNVIKWRTTDGMSDSGFTLIKRPVYSPNIITNDQSNVWQLVTGSSFTWKIRKISIIPSRSYTYIDALFTDGLYFQGGKEIDPLKWPTLNPAKTDATSINAYGRKVLHVEDKNITGFTQAQLIGDYVLEVNKDEAKTCLVIKGAKTWMKPTQTVYLFFAPWEISEYYRAIDVTFKWESAYNLVRGAYSLVPRYQKLGSEAYLAETYGELIKYWNPIV